MIYLPNLPTLARAARRFANLILDSVFGTLTSAAQPVPVERGEFPTRTSPATEEGSE